MIMKVGLMLLLVSSSMVSGGNSPSMLLSVSSTPYSLTPDNLPQSFDIPTKGLRNTTIALSEARSIKMIPIPLNSSLVVNEITGQNDILRYRSNFQHMLNTSQGDIPWYYNPEFTRAEFGLNDSIYAHSRSISYNQSLQGNEILEVDIDGANLAIDPSKMGWISIDLDTDEFWASLVIKYTSSYLDFSTNATGSVKFFTHHNNIKINLTKIAMVANSDIPSLLKEVKISAYGNDYYDFGINITRLSLFRPFHELPLGDGDQALYQGRRIELPKNTTLTINTDADTTVGMKLSQSFDLNTSLEGSLVVSEKELVVKGFFDISILPQNFTYSFHYGSVFNNFSTNLTTSDGESKGDFFVVESSGESNTWMVTAVLRYQSQTTVFLGPVMQGRKLHLWSNLTGSGRKAILYHLSSEEIHPLNKEEDGWYGTVPKGWSKGKILVFVWNDQGFFTKYMHELLLSPATVVSTKSYFLSPARRQALPIILENVTSGSRFLPQYVYSYYNGSLYSFSKNGNITINAGEFSPGSYQLEINATHQGFVPVFFTLHIHIEKMEPKVKISGNRVSTHSGLIQIILPESDNWTIPVKYSISGDGINLSGRMVTTTHIINVTSTAWEGDHRYTLEINLVISTIWKYNTVYVLGALSDSSLNSRTEQQPTIPLLLGGFSSGIIALGTYLVKKYKNRMYAQTIQF